MLKDSMMFTSIATKDLDAAKAWYSEKLGLTPDQERADGIIYMLGSGTGFLLYETKQFAGTAKNTIAGFRVDDLEAEMKELRGRGVKFEDYDFPGLKTENGIAEFPGGRGAWFLDPDGNIFAVSEDA